MNTVNSKEITGNFFSGELSIKKGTIFYPLTDQGKYPAHPRLLGGLRGKLTFGKKIYNVKFNAKARANLNDMLVNKTDGANPENSYLEAVNDYKITVKNCKLYVSISKEQYANFTVIVEPENLFLS